MKKIIISVFFLLAVTSQVLAQGINFEQSTTWKKILEKAKAENKYVFVDCYATWCGPCKMMDKTIYPNDTVGQYMNDHFVSVKVQLDKTRIDDAYTKQWYGTAEMLEKNYEVNAFPCFLFFSPEGKLADKVVGAKLKINEFISFAENALRPDIQYYALLQQYHQGKLDTAELRHLAVTVSYDKNLAGKIAFDYLKQISPEKYAERRMTRFIDSFAYAGPVKELMLEQFKAYGKKEFLDFPHQSLLFDFRSDKEVQKLIVKYLNSLSDNELRTKDNLSLLGMFAMLMHPGDKYFNIFYKMPDETDRAVNVPGWSKGVVRKSIQLTIIDPALQKAQAVHADANWDSLYEVVKKETDAALALETINSSRLKYYHDRMEEAKNKSDDQFFWGSIYAKLLVNSIEEEHIEQWPNDGNFRRAVGLNNDAFDVFLYSSNRAELEQALAWVNKAIAIMNSSQRSDWMDTKANLLYKLGRKEEALALEGQANKMNPKDKEIAETLKNMQGGKPTWPLQANN